MNTVEWAIGEKLQIWEGGDWRSFRVSEHTGDGFNLLDETTRRAIWKPGADLRKLWTERQLRRERPAHDAVQGMQKKLLGGSLCSASEAERAHVRWLAPYIFAFRRSGKTKHASRKELEALIEKVASEEKHKQRPHWRTLSDHLRMITQKNANGRWLLPRIRARGNRTQRFGAFEVTIDEVLRKRILIANRTPMEDVLAELKVALEAYNLSVEPHERIGCALSRRTLERRVAAMDEYEKVAAWEGKQAARRKCVPVGTAPQAHKPLEFVEIDHTVLDVIVVHPTTSKVLGRPIITVAIDRYSRMVVGFHIGFEEPSYKTVMLCLRMSILPKDQVLEKYGLAANAWPCHGPIEMIVLDNGREFHSKDLDDATTQLLIDIKYCRTGTPSDKGIVERWFGRLNQQLIHGLPGTTKSNPKDKGEYDSEAHACLTVAEVRKLVTKWVVEEYALDIHDGIKDAPLNRWLEWAAGRCLDLPAEVEDLDVLLLPAEPRKLTRQGIRMFGWFYSDAERGRVRVLLNDPNRPDDCVVKYDPDDLGWVYLLDWTTQRYIPLKSSEFKTADGLTLREYEADAEAIRRRIRDHEAITTQQLQSARVNRTRVLDELTKHGTARGRKAARQNGADPDAPAKASVTQCAPKAADQRPAKAAPPPSIGTEEDDDLGISLSSIG